MTNEQKQYKLKLIILIMLVEMERFRKTKFNNPSEQLAFSFGFAWWAIEYARVKSIPMFRMGGHDSKTSAIAGESGNEMIIDKYGKMFGVSPLEKASGVISNIIIANRLWIR